MQVPAYHLSKVSLDKLDALVHVPKQAASFSSSLLLFLTFFCSVHIAKLAYIAHIWLQWICTPLSKEPIFKLKYVLLDLWCALTLSWAFSFSSMVSYWHIPWIFIRISVRAAEQFEASQAYIRHKSLHTIQARYCYFSYLKKIVRYIVP